MGLMLFISKLRGNVDEIKIKKCRIRINYRISFVNVNEDAGVNVYVVYIVRSVPRLWRETPVKLFNVTC